MVKYFIGLIGLLAALGIIRRARSTEEEIPHPGDPYPHEERKG